MSNKVANIQDYQIKRSIKNDVPTKKMYRLLGKIVLFYVAFMILTLTVGLNVPAVRDIVLILFKVISVTTITFAVLTLVMDFAMDIMRSNMRKNA